MTPTSPSNPKHKIHNHSSKQSNREHRRPKPIIKPTLPPHPNTLGPPMISKQRINHCRHCNQREQAGGDLAYFVAKIEEADCETAEDYGEV